VRGHIKKISAGGSRRHCAPHLQIASDATGLGKDHRWQWRRQDFVSRGDTGLASWKDRK